MTGFQKVFYAFLLVTIANRSFAHGSKNSSVVEKDDFVGRYPGEPIPKFITRVVNPDKNYIDLCKKTIDSVAELMRSKLVPYKVASTIKGGSLGKGTAVKEMADADLLFPLVDINSTQTLRTNLPKILRDLQSALDRSPYNVTGIKKTPFTIQFLIEIRDVYQDVDLLPIIDLKIKNPTRENLKSIYTEMRKHEDLRNYYGKTLASLQVNFVKEKPEKVKRVIRLLKYWIKTKKHVLKSYGAELLVIKAYEDLGSSLKVKEKDLIMKVFQMLSDLKTLKVSWTKYYDPTSYGIPSAPYILDPAFPYHNLIGQKKRGIVEKYTYLEKDAKRILRTLQNQHF